MIDEEVLERACHGALYPLFQAGPGLFSGGGAGDDSLRRTWRSTLTSRGLSFMEMERGVAELESILAIQRDDGFLPASPGADSAAVPLAATMLRRLYFMALRHQRPLKSRLAALIEPLERYHDLLYTSCRSNLYLSRPADERVLDRRADTSDGRGLLDVGFNAVLIQAESDLADISIHCGRTTQTIMVRRTKRAQALLNKLWHEEHGIFCSRQGPRWLAPTVEGLLPMFAGVLRSGQAADMVLRYLTPGRGFWTPAPLSSVPLEDPGYQPGAIGAGAVCPVVNWLMSFGLYRYGFDELADELSEITKRLIFEQGPWEAFDASTGQGVGRPNDPVTAAIGLCLTRASHQIEGFGHF